MDALVSPQWLSQNLYDSDLVLLDCTVCTIPEEDGGFYNVSGRADYELGHIPNAGFADLKGELCDLNNPVEFSLPTPEKFCNVMAELGIGDDSHVVLYDTNYTAWAARVWWMLRWVGFDRAAILDGGMAGWSAEGHPLSTEIVTRTEKHLTAKPRPELIAHHDEVLASINDEEVVLIDTLPEVFYHGEMSIYARPGHIPGAINIDSLTLLDKTGRFNSKAKLAAMHTFDHDTRAITYCGGGIAASANAFIMIQLGFTNVAVYTDSLQVWAVDPNNPMVVDSPGH